jgi:hypothetical protein
VSPLWTKRLIVGLWPHGITIRDAADLEGSSLAYWPNAVDEVAGSWRNSMVTFQRWTTESAPKRARLDIVVSDCFVRHVVLPWTSDLTDDEEWLALARARVDVTWGHAESWEVRIDRPRFESSCLACAIDRDLRTQLLSLRQPPRLTIRSIQPSFTATFNALCTSISDAPTLVVVGERDSVTIGAIENNHWRNVRTLPTAGGEQAVIGRLIERERLLLGLPPDVSVLQRLAAHLPTHGGVGAR